MQNRKVYFPNLNGIRFIAASLVILTHIEQIKAFKNVEDFRSLYPMETGLLGVTIFFVLSGFLITYLLLSEEQRFNTISIKNFYIRRILRIWPLYYFIVILALFILPHIKFFTWIGYEKELVYTGFFLKAFLFLIFFPNLVHTLLGVVPYASQTWSVGTEEQFYLFWPWVFKIVKRRRVLFMLFLILTYHLFSLLINSEFLNFVPYKHILRAFISTFNIDRMAIGGIFAIILFQKEKFLEFILNEYIFYSSLAIVFILWLNSIYIPFVHFQVYSVLFGLIIVNFAANKKIKISIENRILNYLGNISYGLYMYHPIAIILAISIAAAFQSVSNWIIYPLSFLFSIAMAGISYKYFESYFLKFKERFSKVRSGNQIEKSKELI